MQNSQENTCTRVSFLIKFIKKETLAQVLSCEFCEICKNTSRRLLLNIIIPFSKILYNIFAFSSFNCYLYYIDFKIIFDKISLITWFQHGFIFFVYNRGVSSRTEPCWNILNTPCFNAASKIGLKQTWKTVFFK